VIFYSLYTHTWQLAQAIAEGAKEVEGVEVEMYQVPELLPEEVIKKMGYEIFVLFIWFALFLAPICI